MSSEARLVYYFSCPTPRGREVLWECLAQEHDTITLARARAFKQLAIRQRDSHYNPLRELKNKYFI